MIELTKSMADLYQVMIDISDEGFRRWATQKICKHGLNQVTLPDAYDKCSTDTTISRVKGGELLR